MALISKEIENFLNFSNILNVIVSDNNSDSVLVALNNIPMPDDFIFEVNDMCSKAISCFSDGILEKKITPEYFCILNQRIRDRVNCFSYEDDILTHCKTYVVDKQNRRFNYDDLSDNVKRELSVLFDALRNALIHFGNTISPYSDERKSFLKFKGSKNNLVALAAIWYESDLFDVDSKKFSRNDCIKEFARLLGIIDDNPSKTMDKIKNKAFPLQILEDILKIGKELFLPN